MPDTPLLVRQYLSGRDIAHGDMNALEMANLSYLLADTVRGEALLVDPAWGPLDLVSTARSLGFRVVGVLATHLHADHVGGSLWGLKVPGVPEITAAVGCPVHAHRADAQGILRGTGLPPHLLVSHEDGDRIPLGDLWVTLIHTPGHSPGSSCFRVGEDLFTGDTLFMDGCGRVDLPGSSPEEMITTLTVRLAGLPGHLRVWPGHDYGGRKALLEDLRLRNECLAVTEPRALRDLIL